MLQNVLEQVSVHKILTCLLFLYLSKPFTYFNVTSLWTIVPLNAIEAAEVAIYYI